MIFFDFDFSEGFVLGGELPWLPSTWELLLVIFLFEKEELSEMCLVATFCSSVLP